MSVTLGSIAYVTKLAGFEHTKYIQGNISHVRSEKYNTPLFIGKTVRDGKIDKNYDWYLPSSISEMLPRSQLTKKCLVMPYVGTIGDIAIFEADELCHLGSNIAKIELYDDCGYSEEYIRYFIKSPYGQSLLFRDVQGAIQKNVTMESIRNLELPDIDENEQNRIVEVLNSIEHKIELNNSICVDLEAMAKQIYDYWFVQFDFPDANGRPYKSSGGKMVWNEELKREIPEGWDKGNLYDIANFINGLACQKFRPIDDVHKLPVVKITEMHDGISDNTEWVRDDIDDSHIIDDGTILFSWSASLEVQIWNGGKAGLNQHIFKIEPKVQSANYVYLQLASYVVNFVRMAEARKTTMGHITTDHLKQSMICVPDNNTLIDFESKTKDLFDKLTMLKAENRELAEMRDFLLPMLMNGQIKVS